MIVTTQSCNHLFNIIDYISKTIWYCKYKKLLKTYQRENKANVAANVALDD